MPVIALDGELFAEADARISVLDRGVLYGDGLFEILRTWDGVAVTLAAHLDRLEASARILALPLPSRATIAATVARVIAAAGAGDQRVRIAVTRGPGPLRARLAELTAGRWFVIADPIGDEAAHGVAVAIVDWPVPARGVAWKALAYLDHIYARELAAAAGADEALRCDANGAIVEGATSNVFAVVRGGLVTPPAAGILAGVTRADVLALAPSLDVAVVERVLLRDELARADEVFVTSAVRGITPVVQLDGVPRVVGEVTRRLAHAYRERMRAAAARARGSGA